MYKKPRETQNGAQSKNKWPEKKYDLANLEEDQVVWVYAQWNGDFWFVDVEGIAKWFYVFGRNSMNAMPGDKVLAQTKMFKGRTEAVVLAILERRKDPIVGIFQAGKSVGKKWPTFGFVVPKNNDFKKDFFVSWTHSKNAKNGDLVAVEIVKWEGRNPEARVITNLWDPSKRGVDIMAIALEAWARIGFGEIIKKELATLPKSITDVQRGKRQDLTDVFTITIDGPDSKDLDDAISLEQKGDDFILSVHIADVAHYVKHGHAIDKEALRRATSIYLVDRVIPMLPEQLSNGLCSLNPHEEKLTLTCEMLVNAAGHVKNTKVFESITKSDYRMTYKEVDEIVYPDLSLPSDTLMFGGKVTPTLESMLKNCEVLRAILSTYKHTKGVLDFDFPETKIEVDEDGNPIAFTKYERYKSNKIIEEFMVLANEAVSKKYQNLPFLYRTHLAPSEEDINKLRSSLAIFSYTLPQVDSITTLDIQKILEKISGDPKEKLLSKMVLRALTKAEYFEKADGHFGLGLDYYSHFTSPIRRYPDLQIHRIIKEQIIWKFDKTSQDHYDMILPKVAQRSSDKERAAEKLEYKVRDLMACKYMEKKIGEKFSANISGIIEKGVFVELENTVEGFVELNGRFSGWNFEFIPELMELREVGTKTKYQIGDALEVELKTVDMERLRIDFELFVEE